MTSQARPVSIFDFTDYREYMRAYYAERKKTLPAFSYRFFARKVGIKSVGLYKDVVEGRLSLGRTFITRFSKAMGHKKREAEYFENMVRFCESTTVEERQVYFTRMMALREARTAIVDASRFEYYSKWYYCAVRALLAIRPFDGDYARLGKTLKPAITANEARRAVKLLERLGFIRKNADGVLELTDEVITTGSLSSDNPAVNHLNVVTHQRTLNRLGNEAYDRFASSSLDMSTVTVGVSHETYRAIKEEVASLRRKILSMAQGDDKPDRIYQINYQVFPLMDIEGEKKS